MADNHTVYKNGAKEIAHLNGCSITFMAKPDHEWIGNSCHVHSSLWREGESAFAGESDVFKQYLAGPDRLPEGAGDLHRADDQLVQALRARELGADDARLGPRQPHAAASASSATAPALRTETRIPGGDVNPYLAFAALLAAGLHGIENELELPPPLEGNAYESDAERFPSSLREGIAALEQGTMARAALGDDVVDHYLNYARTEQRLFDEAVTCWERERLYERG